MHPDVAREVARWLRYAREDLASAQALAASPDAPPRHAAWLAQQAAEKAIKAVLVATQTPFPFIHDLARLRALVPDGWGVRTVEADLALLTEFAVEARYPDDLPDVTSEEAGEGIVAAVAVLASVGTDLQPRLDDIFGRP